MSMNINITYDMTPDDCFDEMAKVLMPDTEPSEVAYIDLLEEVKKLKEDENQCWKAIAKNKTEILMKYLPDYNPILSGGSDSENIEGCLKKLLDENKKLKNDLRLCADGLIPDGMVGGIVECEREKRHKAEEEVKKYKRLASDLKQAIICKVA